MHWKKVKNPYIKNNQLASKYNVSESTVSEILKKSDYFLSLNPNQFTANSYREKSTKYPEIEQSLALWIDQAASDKGNSKFLNLLPRLSELIYDSNNNFGL